MSANSQSCCGTLARSPSLNRERGFSKTATDGCGSFAPSRGQLSSNSACSIRVVRVGIVGAATKAIWLILPVVICLSQRLSHACLSVNFYTVKLRMAH